MLPPVAVRVTFPLVVMGAVELMLRPAVRLMAAARLALPRAVAWLRSELVPAAEKDWLPLRPVRRALLASERLPAVAAICSQWSECIENKYMIVWPKGRMECC